MDARDLSRHYPTPRKPVCVCEGVCECVWECASICNQYIKILVVCVSVTDVGVAVTDLRVVCKSITYVSAFTEAFTKMAIIFLEIVKAAAGLDTHTFVILYNIMCCHYSTTQNN